MESELTESLKMNHQDDMEHRVHQNSDLPLPRIKDTHGQAVFFRRVSVLGAGAAIIIALMGLLSYIPGFGLLGSVREGYIPMAPSTAVSFIILGGILLYITLLSVSDRSFAFLVTLAGLVSIFGILEVVGYFTGMDLNFEDALVPGAGYLGDIPIARMAYPTGAAFFIAGLAALSLILRRDRTQVSDLRLGHCGCSLGSLMLIISLIFCSAYLFGSPLLYGQGATVPMALTTALAFLMLGFATVGVAGRESFPVSLFTATHLTTDSMSARKRVLVLLFIMVGSCSIAVMVVTAVLYRHETQEKREMLQVTAQSQARLIEAMVRSDEVHVPGNSKKTTLNQIKEAHANYMGFGETGEFTLAQRNGDSIVFILRHRYSTLEYPAPVPFDSKLAEPMRRALKGLSGTIIGLDYRGQTVLAAYEPVGVLNLGIVAKMDLLEFRKPFIRSVLAAATVSLLVILLSAMMFFRISNPIIERLETYAQDLEKEVEERKRAEATLRVSEEQFRTIFMEAPLGIALIDSLTGHIYEVNPRFAEIAGRTRKEMLTINWMEITHPDDIQEDLDNMALLNAGEIHGFSMQKRYIHPDDSIVWINMTIAPVKVEDKSQPRHLCMIEDITAQLQAEDDRKKLDIHLRQQQKLESIGTLASGIAHEINNPINGIMNYAELIRDELHEDNPSKEYAAEIGNETRRIATITRNLLTFSRQDKESHSPAIIKDIVDETISLIAAVIRHDQIMLDLDIPDDLPSVRCRSQQIQQVLMNLLTNARDALNDRYPEYAENKILSLRVRPFEKDGHNWVRLTVEDHGNGIPEEIRDRIFDPFFTTKDRTKGTGLGLSISHGIIQEHLGEMHIECNPGQYTRFHVDLRVNNGWTLDGTGGKEVET